MRITVIKCSFYIIINKEVNFGDCESEKKKKKTYWKGVKQRTTVLFSSYFCFHISKTIKQMNKKKTKERKSLSLRDRLEIVANRLICACAVSTGRDWVIGKRFHGWTRHSYLHLWLTVVLLWNSNTSVIYLLFLRNFFVFQ